MAADDVYHHVGELTGLTAFDAAGEKIGTVEQAYLDNETGRAEWVTVKTGMFGMKESFVPLAGARRDENGLQIPHTKDMVKEAPRMDADEHLDIGQEQELYDHYGLARPSGRSGAPSMSPAPSGDTGERGTKDTTTAAAGGEGAAGPSSESGREAMAGRADSSAAGTDQGMIRSEEQLRVDTEEYESGRARLRKVVVTENVKTSVPITHEEVRVVREPIEAGDRMAGRAPFSDAQTEVILHAEEPVIRKEAVAVERVRLETEKVTEQKEVTADVRKERVEYDAPSREALGKEATTKEASGMEASGKDEPGHGGGRGPSH